MAMTKKKARKAFFAEWRKFAQKEVAFDFFDVLAIVVAIFIVEAAMPASLRNNYLTFAAVAASAYVGVFIKRTIVGFVRFFRARKRKALDRKIKTLRNQLRLSAELGAIRGAENSK